MIQMHWRKPPVKAAIALALAASLGGMAPGCKFRLPSLGLDPSLEAATVPKDEVKTASKAEPKAAEAESPKLVLQDIKSALNLEEKAIILVTNNPVKYTSFMMDRPPRLAVELTGVSSAIPSEPIFFDDDLVAKINVINFKKANVTRVEIRLRKTAKHAVIANDSGVEIRLLPVIQKKDLNQLAEKLVEAEAEVLRLTAENQELKELLGMQNEKLKENLETIKALEGQLGAKSKKP